MSEQYGNNSRRDGAQIAWGRSWMETAVDMAANSVSEEARKDTPKVGALAVKDGEFLACSCRGCCDVGAHAEYCVLEALTPEQQRGATVFTTLEPCTNRGSGKIPCVYRLIEAGVKKVYIGMYDPNPRVSQKGSRLLREANIEVNFFAKDLREEIESMNQSFTSCYREAEGDTGVAYFNYERNDGQFLIKTSFGDFVTEWSGGSSNSIYIGGYPAPVNDTTNFGGGDLS